MTTLILMKITDSKGTMLNAIWHLKQVVPPTLQGFDNGVLTHGYNLLSLGPCPSFTDFLNIKTLCGGPQWRSWLRHCTTSQKVAGSIPDGVIGIFHWHNPSGHIMALGSTQPLTELSTGNISWGVKSGRCVGLTTLPPSCADCLEIWEPQPPGILWVCSGL